MRILEPRASHMGGYIKVVIRFNDGSIHADTYGTNALSYWTRHPKTIRGDDSVMRRYVEVCTTWNNGDRTYTPVEYGVFAIDFQTRTILSANDYSDGMTWLVQEVRDMAQRFGVEEENGYTVFDEMLYFGWVSLRETHRDKFEDGERIPSAVPPREISLAGVRADRWDEDVYRRYEHPPGLSWKDRYDRPMYKVVFAYPGWTVESVLDRDIEAQDRLRSRLRDLGFPFDAANEAAYEKWKHRRLESFKDEEPEDA